MSVICSSSFILALRLSFHDFSHSDEIVLILQMLDGKLQIIMLFSLVQDFMLASDCFFYLLRQDMKDLDVHFFWELTTDPYSKLRCLTQ